MKDDIVKELRIGHSVKPEWRLLADAADEIERLRKEREEYAHEIYRLRAAIDDVVAETYGDHQPEWASAAAMKAGKDPMWCRFCGARDGDWPCTHRTALDALKEVGR